MSRREEKNNDGTKQKQCTTVLLLLLRRTTAAAAAAACSLLLKGAFDNNAKSFVFLSHGSVVGESHGVCRRIVCRGPEPRSPTAIAWCKLRCTKVDRRTGDGHPPCVTDCRRGDSNSNGSDNNCATEAIDFRRPCGGR
ncbi:hypothetical protein ACI65C_005300 [Semiaphis heraclei]